MSDTTELTGTHIAAIRACAVDSRSIGTTADADLAIEAADMIAAGRLRTGDDSEPEIVDVVAAVRWAKHHAPARPDVWLCKRNSDGDHAGLAGMWEYPGGKVESGEQLRDALVRELQGEFPGACHTVSKAVCDCGHDTGAHFHGVCNKCPCCEFVLEVEAGVGPPNIGKVLDCIDSPYGDVTYRVTFFEVHMDDPTEHPTHSQVRWMSASEACSVDHLPSGTIFNARHLAPDTEREPDGWEAAARHFHDCDFEWLHPMEECSKCNEHRALFRTPPVAPVAQLEPYGFVRGDQSEEHQQVILWRKVPADLQYNYDVPLYRELPPVASPPEGGKMEAVGWFWNTDEDERLRFSDRPIEGHEPPTRRNVFTAHAALSSPPSSEPSE